MKSITKKISRLIDTLKIKIRRKYITMTAMQRRKKIVNDDFSIISNNCWGGLVYQSYGLQYRTPTIGMFMMASDYIKFISNMEYYLSIDSFSNIDPKKSKWKHMLEKKDNFGTYPIAGLGDIEIHLLHYKSTAEAEKKWNRRKKRINYSKIIYKFSEMNYCQEQNIKDFQNLKLKNKICFITNKYSKYKNDYTFVVSNSKNDVKAFKEPVGKNCNININEFINKMN